MKQTMKQTIQERRKENIWILKNIFIYHQNIMNNIVKDIFIKEMFKIYNDDDITLFNDINSNETYNNKGEFFSFYKKSNNKIIFYNYNFKKIHHKCIYDIKKNKFIYKQENENKFLDNCIKESKKEKDIIRNNIKNKKYLNQAKQEINNIFDSYNNQNIIINNDVKSKIMLNKMYGVLNNYIKNTSSYNNI